MIQIAALLAGWPARIGVIVAAFVALVGLRQWDKSHQQAIGGKKVEAKINEANDHATKLGRRAADGSTASGVRGQRDPSTRND